MQIDKRFDIADQIQELFNSREEVSMTSLRGSLSSGLSDKYSDIDIAVDVSGCDNGSYMATVISVMNDNFDLFFYDYAPSLAPEGYVVSFFVRGYPIFWNIDIKSEATPHYATVSQEQLRETRDPVEGWLKVWVHSLKYLLRGKPDVEPTIPWLMCRLMRIESVPEMPYEQMLKLMLDEIARRADGRFPDFVEACYQLYDQEIGNIGLFSTASGTDWSNCES